MGIVAAMDEEGMLVTKLRAGYITHQERIALARMVLEPTIEAVKAGGLTFDAEHELDELGADIDNALDQA